jgi:hypothetical protein
MPIAKGSGIAVARISPGTIRNPPPMPKNPAARPTPSPIGIRRGSSVAALSRVSLTSGASAVRRLRSIDRPTPTISSPNRTSSRLPSNAFPNSAPSAAPTIPAPANTAAHRHFTRPTRAWPIRLASAFTVTATVAVPIAACGDPTPTT